MTTAGDATTHASMPWRRFSPPFRHASVLQCDCRHARWPPPRAPIDACDYISAAFCQLQGPVADAHSRAREMPMLRHFARAQKRASLAIARPDGRSSSRQTSSRRAPTRRTRRAMPRRPRAFSSPSRRLQVRWPRLSRKICMRLFHITARIISLADAFAEPPPPS